MKKTALIIALFCASVVQVFAWGQKGHDVSTYIAEKNLSKKTLKQVKELLDGRSIVYYSSWLDTASHTDEYKYTSTWHYRNVDKGLTPSTAPENPNGDVVKATAEIIEKLKNRKANNMSREEEQVAVKMLVHLVGDLHCPMHAGRLSDRGGNQRTVYFFGRKTNLHSIWDSSLIESAHKWGYAEWWEQLDILDKKSKKVIAAGTPEEWFEDSFEAASKVYAETPEDAKVSYDYIAKMTPIAEKQLLYAGIRLAAALNEIYD